ncbi:MAG: sel1 repeat family protein [Magnetococcales bacterium]|nr:sel1 repeat family protein [Magnetococcales bacterium]
MAAIFLPLPLLALLVLWGFDLNISIDILTRQYQGQQLLIKGDGSGAFHAWQPLAKAGVPKVQEAIGDLYRHGVGVKKDPQRAAQWYRKAALRGRKEAQSSYAEMLLRGEGLSKDVEAAHFWFRRAADLGYAKAQKNLAQLYYEGREVPQDYPKAMKWYRLLAENRDTQGQNGYGMNMVALMRFSGHGGRVEPGGSLSDFEQAVRFGSVQAMHNLATILHQGAGGVLVDHKRALQLARMAARKGHPGSAFLAGVMLINGRGGAANPQEGVSLLRYSASRGDARAVAALKQLTAVPALPSTSAP